MSDPVSGESCSTCRFFAGDTCRRRAPVVMEEYEQRNISGPGVLSNVEVHRTIVRQFPPVNTTDYCGEWEAKE